MCGIVGAVSQRNIVPMLIAGLGHLEYRGYDSSGIAVLQAGNIQRVRTVGRVSALIEQAQTLQSMLGIGHTRWATHGEVSEANAHPHVSHDEIAVVHNGIIENYDQERARLEALGYQFGSQTDTEIIAHLIHYYVHQGETLLQATQRTVKELSGAFAIAVMSRHVPSSIVVARQGCPLLIGLGEGENFVASDVSAMLAVTRRVLYLEDGEVAEVSAQTINLYDANGASVERAPSMSNMSLSALELGPYTHFMQKEIHEQARAINATIEALMDNQSFSPSLFGDDEGKVLSQVNSVLLLAAGTSYYAALTARYWIESIAKLPTQVEIASEYRYRQSVPNPQQLILTISQSGETLDTLEALKHAQSLGQPLSLTICNIQESAIARASRLQFYTRAGVEIGVASTKAFTTQLTALFVLAVTLGKLRGEINQASEKAYLGELRALAGSVQHTLNLEAQIQSWAERFADKQHALFLGRGIHYPIALEGALKLKEVSYIHAEAYPAGELKHGPLALVDEDMPVVVIAPNDRLLEKVKANMQEVKARGGKLFVFADADSQFADSDSVQVIRTPRHMGALSPIVHSVPVQLLAYHAALFKGTDVDKPRNLAKSVTVE